MEENFIPNENVSGNTENMEATEKSVALLLAKKDMKKCFNRIGWAVFAAVGTWIALVTLVALFAVIWDGLRIFSSFSAVDFYNKHLLIFNEVLLFVGILVGLLILSRVPKISMGSEMPTFGRFIQVLSVCFAVGYVANVVSNIFLIAWTLISGISVNNDVMEAISLVDPIQMIVMVGIVGPILEEFFFRKLLIDRIRPYGELPSILVTALLFALFHQSAIQFLYAFAVGIVLGYVYYRTGNFLMVTLLHVSFNIISGVIPTLLLPDVLAFLEDINYLSQMYAENGDVLMRGMMAAFEQYGTALILYGIHALFVFAFNIAGIVFFVIKVKKFRACKGRYAILPSEKMRAIFFNPGMICTLILLGALTVLSLFSSI